MQLSRASLAQLGRNLSRQTSIATKHCIKRIDRFIANRRVEPIEAMRGLVEWLARPRNKLLVSMDWVDIRDLKCLVLTAWLQGRAIPLLWAVYHYEDFYRSQNSIEYGLLKVFRMMMPESVAEVILADRGFGMTEIARECQKLQFGYVIRIQPKVYIKGHGFAGRLTDFAIRLAQKCILHNVLYRKYKPVRQHVAVIWQQGQLEPWYLMTNLDKLPAGKLSKVFGRRMTIEEYFRDLKTKRNGFALRLTMIKDSERLSRFLLILAPDQGWPSNFAQPHISSWPIITESKKRNPASKLGMTQGNPRVMVPTTAGRCLSMIRCVGYQSALAK